MEPGCLCRHLKNPAPVLPTARRRFPLHSRSSPALCELDRVRCVNHSTPDCDAPLASRRRATDPRCGKEIVSNRESIGHRHATWRGRLRPSVRLQATHDLQIRPSLLRSLSPLREIKDDADLLTTRFANVPDFIGYTATLSAPKRYLHCSHSREFRLAGSEWHSQPESPH